MRATVDRPVRISGALLAIAVLTIVAIIAKISELLEARHRP
jgi:hypothetical protein